MGSKSKVGGLISAVVLATGLTASVPSYADHRYEPARGNNLYSEENTKFPVLDVVIDESLPNYLKGVRRISEEVQDYQLQRWQESYRVHTISTLEHQTGPNLNFVNQAVSFNENIHGKNVRFVLQDYMVANKHEGGKSNEVLFYNGTGGLNEFPMDELKKIKKDLVYRITESAKRNTKQFGGIFSEARAKLAKRLGMTEEEFERQAEEQIVLRGGVKVLKGAFLDYPNKDLEPKDFVPNTVIFGNHSDRDKGMYLYAAVYPDSGIMYLTPLSLKLDHISDGHSTVRHEMIHANRKLQNYNLNNMMDAELFASFPWLDSTTPQSEMYGSYFNAIKWTIKTYMCFDLDQANSELKSLLFTVPTFKTSEANLNKFRKYAQWIDTAKDTLKKATRNAMVEFYSDPSWFGALNDKLGYDNAGFDLLMSQQLEPTCLGGPEKTLEWIAENQGKIDSLWSDAVKELEKDKSENKKNNQPNNALNNSALSKMYSTFRVIQSQYGQKAAENFVLENIDSLVPYLGELSGENLQMLKENLSLKDIETQRKVLGALEEMSLRNKIKNLK
jgi:hypothetical protein